MNELGDFENRLQRNNLCLIGVLEKADGSNSGDFFEQWLSRVMGKDRLVFFACGGKGAQSDPGVPSHPLLVRIFHFKDRVTILQIARDLYDLKIDNHKISIFFDCSAQVQRRRMQFLDIKKRLCVGI